MTRSGVRSSSAPPIEIFENSFLDFLSEESGMRKLNVRFATEKDIEPLYQLFNGEPFKEPREKFQAYVEQSQKKICLFALAEVDGQLCSMVTAHFKPAQFAPMDKSLICQNIPEVKSLQTQPGFEGNGAATALMDFIEAEVRREGYHELGLTVGLYPSYGTAQRMYVKRGYIPDGKGISYEGRIVPPGEMIRLDDALTLCMIKKL